MIFNLKSSTYSHEELEIQGYISSSSDTDSRCHSILSSYDEMTGSNMYDISMELEKPQSSANISVDEYHSQEYYNDIETINRHHQSTHCLNTYQPNAPSNQYSESIIYGQETSSAKNDSNSTISVNSSFNEHVYSTLAEELNSPQQASPDSQHSYYVLNEGKYCVLGYEKLRILRF